MREPVSFVALMTALTDIRRGSLAARASSFVARFGKADRITTLPFLHSSAVVAPRRQQEEEGGGESSSVLVRSLARGEPSCAIMRYAL